MLNRSSVVYCSRQGCMAHTERGADGRPVDRKWLTYTNGCMVRHFCTEAHYTAWRQAQPGYVAPVVEAVTSHASSKARGMRKGTAKGSKPRDQWDPVDELDDAEAEAEDWRPRPA